MTLTRILKRVLLWGTLLAVTVVLAFAYRFMYQFGAVTTIADLAADKELAWAAFGDTDGSMNDLLAQADDERDYQPLFDGATLAGWNGATGYWRVENGEIVGESKELLKIPQYLVSDAVVDDFIIKFYFFAEGESFANTGLFYRVEVVDGGTPPIVAYQADIDFLGFTKWAGGFYHEHGLRPHGSLITFSGERVWVGPDGGRVLVKQLEDAEQLVSSIGKGEWGSYTVIAKGGRFIHRINGVVFSDTLLSTVSLTSGALALQLHPGPPMSVRFRNPRIKKFKDEA
jgi:hypothetical protein